MITLELPAAGPVRPTPVRVEASEAISECFRVTVDVLSDQAIAAASVLNKAAAVTMGDDPQTRRFAGVVTGLTAHGTISGGQFWYRLQIEPSLRLLDLTSRSRVFCTEQPAAVPLVLQLVLSTAIDVAPIAAAVNLASNAYPLRDMIVQYEETDLRFLTRLAEHSGVFWLVDQVDGVEQVLFGDSNLAFPQLDFGAGGNSLPFRPSVGRADTAFAIRGAGLESVVVPKGATLNEWSFRTPKMDLSVASDFIAGEIGLQQSWGSENYETSAWGAALAGIRAQEAAAARAVLIGQTNAPPLRAGALFTMTGHSAPDLDGQYVATNVVHRAWQSVAGAEYLPGAIPPGSGYGNEFRAIPMATVYRPIRRTTKPSIPGLVRAVIDATEPVPQGGVGMLRSNVDAAGFYRVVFPFDTAQHPPGKASCAIRLLSVYGGPAEGLHFPLRPGTQVMVAFHNGDPDRPVIVGAIPDQVQASVVTTTNRSVNTIRTASGILMRFDDGLPSP